MAQKGKKAMGKGIGALFSDIDLKNEGDSFDILNQTEISPEKILIRKNLKF